MLASKSQKSSKFRLEYESEPWWEYAVVTRTL